MVYKIEGKTRVLEEKTPLEQTKRARTNLTDPQLASMPGLVPRPRCYRPVLSGSRASFLLPVF